ncbi:MAG: helix-turn-helix transcriptional regulator, partial [Atopobiaceae bacterium]|nr:helix-turn-helix transcriptional regulator [Atopobiaceae bacterium]
MGLLLGRVGDALGSGLYVALGANQMALVTTTSVLFSCAMVLLFALYQRQYLVLIDRPLSEQEIFERFCARHDLSSREREVLRLLLAERSNSEIAAELFVSEATVKYHVRNLLRKTGCHSRVEIMAVYATGE